MKNLDLEPLHRPSAFRQIALGTWGHPSDPSVYGAIDLDVAEALRYLQAFRDATGRRLTLTHMVARAMGAVLEEAPECNAIVRWGRIYLRRDRTVFFQVAMKDPETGRMDLSGVTVERAHERSLLDILDAFEASVAVVRSARRGENVEDTRQLFKRLPGALVGRLLRLISFVLFDLNLNLDAWGIPSRTFGAIAVTNVGALGIEEAFAPLVPFSRAPMVIALGSVRKAAVVDDDDRIVVGQRMKLFATFDHRVMDGAHAAKMSRIVRAWIEDPWNHFDAIPSGAVPVVEAGVHDRVLQGHEGPARGQQDQDESEQA